MSSTIISFLTTCGDIGQYALPIGVGLHAIYKGHRKEGLALGVSAGIQQIVLDTLKKVIAAPRPYPNHLRLDSFPSGHSAGAFLAVGFLLALDRIYPEKSDKPYLNTAYKTSIFSLALVVAISRYLCRMHWPIDIAAGSSLGLFFGSAASLIPHLINKSRLQICNGNCEKSLLQ